MNPWLLSILSGILLGLSRPSIIHLPALAGLWVLVAYVPVFKASLHASVKKTFWFGFTSSFIQYFITIYWFVIAMTDFGHVPIWMSFIVLSLACVILSLYMACAFAASKYIAQRFKWSFLVVIPIALSGVEYLRNWIFLGGFPWVASSYALTSVPVLLQGASIVGVYGLVLAIGICNAAMTRFDRRLATFASLLMISWLSYGTWQLSHEPVSTDSVRVGLIQGNIGQGIKNEAFAHADDILLKYRILSKTAIDNGAELLVWPESSYPLSISSQVREIFDLGDLPAATVMGGVRFDSTYLYNSAFILGPSANIISHVDKSHLVPFGEYVPWPFESIVSRIVPGMGSFGRGNDFKSVEVDLPNNRKISLGVTVCYEGVFPEISRDFVKNGANLLVNITNDAWYGVSSAPYQHLAMYAMRSVETARPYVRATNTGVSAWIDARGYIHDATELYTEAVVTASIPLNHEKTVYMWLGDSLAYLSLLFITLTLILAILGRDVLTRKRSWLEWIVGGAGFALVAWSHWHFSEGKFNLDEAAATKDTFVTALGLIVGTLAWSGKLRKNT